MDFDTPPNWPMKEMAISMWNFFKLVIGQIMWFMTILSRIINIAPYWKIMNSEIIFPEVELSGLDMLQLHGFQLNEICWSLISLKLRNGRLVVDINNLIVTYTRKNSILSQKGIPTPCADQSNQPSTNSLLLKFLPSVDIRGNVAQLIARDTNASYEVQVKGYHISTSPVATGKIDLDVSSFSLSVTASNGDGGSNDMKIVEALEMSVCYMRTPVESGLDATIAFLGGVLDPSSIVHLTDTLLSTSTRPGCNEGAAAGSGHDSCCLLDEFLSNIPRRTIYSDRGMDCDSDGSCRSALPTRNQGRDDIHERSNWRTAAPHPTSAARVWRVSLNITSSTVAAAWETRSAQHLSRVQSNICSLSDVSTSFVSSPSGDVQVQCMCAAFSLGDEDMYGDVRHTIIDTLDISPAAADNWLNMSYSYRPDMGVHRNEGPLESSNSSSGRHELRISIREPLVLRASAVFVSSLVQVWRDSVVQMAAQLSRTQFRKKVVRDRADVHAIGRCAQWEVDVACAGVDFGVVLPDIGDVLIVKFHRLSVQSSPGTVDSPQVVTAASLPPRDIFHCVVSSVDILSWTCQLKTATEIMSLKHLTICVPQSSPVIIPYRDVLDIVQANQSTMNHTQWHTALQNLFSLHSASQPHQSLYQVDIKNVLLHGSNINCDACISVLASVHTAFKAYVTTIPSYMHVFNCYKLGMTSLTLSVREMEVVVAHSNAGSVEHEIAWTVNGLLVSCLDVGNGLMRSQCVSVKQMSDIVLRRDTSSSCPRPAVEAILVQVDLLADVGGRRVLLTQVIRPEGLFTSTCHENPRNTGQLCSSGSPLGLCFISSCTNITLQRLECIIDPMVLTLLLDVYLYGTRLSHAAVASFHRNSGRMPCNVLTMDWIHFNSPLCAEATSSIVTKCSIDEVYVKLDYDAQPVGFWLTKELRLGTLSLPTAGVYQITGSLQRLCVADLTEDTSCTKNLAEYANAASGDLCSSASGDSTSMLQFHFTTYLTARPLFEAKSSNIRVVYLQRAVLTMVNFFWERIIVRVMNPDPHGPLVKPHPEEHLQTYDDNVYTAVFHSQGPFNTITGDNGAMRFSWNICNSELHIPVSSCSEDAIVIVFRQLQLFRYLINYEFMFGGEGYSRGPQLRSDGQDMWLSDLSTMASHDAAWSSGGNGADSADGSGHSAGFKWRILYHLKDLISPEAFNPSYQPMLHDGQLSIELTGGIICSWCSDNAIARNVNLHCLLTLQDVKAAPSGMYTCVFDTLGYQCSMPLALYAMELTMEDIDWVLSRGQYMAIVSMLSYNFCEANKVTPLLVGCEPIKVQLNTNLHGKRCMDDRLPLFIAASLLVGQGRIHMIENTREYYRKLFQAHRDNAALCSACADGLHQAGHAVSLQEAAEYVRSWFDMYNECPVGVADVSPKRDRFRVPSWSTHHEFSRFMYFGLDYFEELALDGSSDGGDEDGNDSAAGNGSSADGEDDIRSSKTSLDSIGFIFFTTLEFTLLRWHHGGGLCMEVGSSDFIITKGSQWTSFRPFTTSSPGSGTNSMMGLRLSRGRERDIPTAANYHDTVPDGGTVPVKKYRDKRIQDPVEVLYDIENVPPEFIIIKQRADMNPSSGEYSSSLASANGDANVESIAGGILSPIETPSIFYSQHGVGNLRRCVVHLSDCVAVAHVPAITRLINYFCECVFLADLREKEYMTGPLQLGSNNFRCMLDIEVYAVDTLVCFPNYSMKCEPDTRGLCLGLSSLQYTHAYRGLLEAGPGWSGVIVAADIANVFIAPLDDIDSKDVESIISSMVLGFTDRYTVVPPPTNAYPNYTAVRVDMDVPLPAGMEKNISKGTQKATYTQYMMLTIKPGDPIYTEDADDDEVIAQMKAESLSLDLKLSIPDVKFVLAVHDSLMASFRNRVMRPPMKEVFGVLFTSYHDIALGMRYTDYLAYVPNAQTPELRVSEFILDTTSAHVLIRNNTYGVKIMRLKIREPRYSFTKSNVGVNIAGGFGAMLFLHNPKMAAFDPVVEHFKITAICATDVSTDALVATPITESDTIAPKLRFDVYFEPVEINVAHSMFVGAISKLSLGDVITSKSASLPVYRVVNKLGVSVICKLNVGRYEDSYVSKELPIDGTCAVDTRLYESAQSERQRYRRLSSWQYLAAAHHSGDDDSHTIEISFTMAGVSYRSTRPVPIDNEGIFDIQMRPKYTGRAVGPAAVRLDSEDNDDGFVDISAPPELLYTQQAGNVLITVLMDMRVVDAEGTRELRLRSVLSIRNNTDSALDMYAELQDVVSGVQLNPDEEWFLPVDVISSHTALYMRMCNHRLGERDEKSSEDYMLDTLTLCNEYVKVWSSLYCFVQVGGNIVSAISRGSTVKLRGSLATLHHDQSINGELTELSQWTTLLLPEHLDIVSGSGEDDHHHGKKTKHVVKYPAPESFTQEFLAPSAPGRESAFSGEDSVLYSQQSLQSPQILYGQKSSPSSRRFSFKKNRSSRGADSADGGDTERSARSVADAKLQNVIPARINILPTLHFTNLICQPILYRIREKKSQVNCCEGTLLPGSTVNIYQNPFKALYTSVRMLNYTWTPWFKIPAFPSSPKSFEEVLESPTLHYEDLSMRLPPLTFVISCQDRFMKLYCPLWLINRSGMNLQYREGSVLSHGSHDKVPTRFVPHRAIQRIENTLVHLAVPPPVFTRETKDTPTVPRATLAPFLADISKRGSRYGRDRAVEHLVAFKICSPFDHCKAITVTMRDSCTLEQLIVEAVKQFMSAAGIAADEIFASVNGGGTSGVGAIRASDYLAYFLGSFTPSLAMHSLLTYDQMDTSVSSNTSSHNAAASGSTPGRPKYSVSDDLGPDLRALDASMSVSQHSCSSQILSHAVDATTHELDIRTVLGMNAAPYVSAKGSELSHSTPLSAIAGPHCILLCHISQARITKQIADVKIVPKRKDSSVVSRLGFKKFIPVLPFVHFEGDIPFNPGGMLGMFPSFSVCVPNDTEWSDSVNVQKVDFAVTGAKHMDLIRARSSIAATHHANDTSVAAASSLYEMALLVQKGDGACKHIAAVTIVPRLILSSKLPFALQIRQVVLDESGTVIQFSEPFVLLPGSVQQYHHPLNRSTKIVQMVQYSCTDEEEYLSMEWSGELNISILGVAHVRLRNPDKIVNIRVESVGASSLATFSLQSLKWPPYRINNTTSFDVRVKQVCRKGRKCLFAPDIAPPRSSIPFAWDYCFNYTEEKLLLQIDFSQIGNRCVSVEFPLNEVDHTATVSLTRPLPDLTQPVAEGFLEVKSNQSTDWKMTYCVVHSDTLFMFSSSRMNEIMGVVNLSVPKQSEKTLDNFDTIVEESTDEVEFACVRKYRKKDWDISMMFSKTIGLNTHPSDYDGMKEHYEKRMFWDINSLRRILLSIANHCHLYESLAEAVVDAAAAESRSADSKNDSVEGNQHDSTEKVGKEEASESQKQSSDSGQWASEDLMLHALRIGFSVDELLHHAKTHAIRCSDILSALVDVKAAPNEKFAFYLLKEMCDKRYIKRVQLPETSDNESEGKAPVVDISAVDGDEGGGDILVDLQFSDWLVLCAPSLAHEMETQIIPARESNVKDAASTILSFELDVGASSYRFKCSTGADLFRWMYGSRLCVEKTWVAHLLRNKEGAGDSEVLTVASLETAAKICVRTDGPTKVLDISEIATGLIKGAAAASEGSAREPESPSTAALDTSEDGVAATIEGDGDAGAASEEVFVSVFLPSIGISVIDNEPTELCYLNFRDIQVTIERTPLNIMSALTIQYIQIDNQLLNPLYPVCFRPRTNIGQGSGDGGGKKKVLMLPGLHQTEGAFPTVHCFVQQRLSVGTSTTSFGRTDENESDLMYFDLLSMWIAPVELSLDEEILVRVLRVFRAIQIAYDKVRSGTRISVDGELLNERDKNILALSTAHYQSLQTAGVLFYRTYSTTTSSLFLSKNIYFALLQLHPVDLVLSIRSTPDFTMSSTEDNFLTLAVRVDYGHVRLNALMINNVFGMTSFITSILSKHYTHALLSQIYALIGSTDVAEGSVGLLTNLGTGVYDFFYEPIEGLLGDEQTFMEGLSKGGKSLASKAIGGTSAFTSKITGGLGKGMSMLTFDSRYQKNRAKDRLRAAQSVSEGLFVGSYEFGKNVFEGVTGIVVEPYRGWVEEGGKGLGKGIAKGILGVALKPAVGVLDLASRTTEGIRHAAFNTRLEADYLGITGRIRYPRQFGRFGDLVCYDLSLSTMQMIVDRLTQPTRETRFYVLHYLPVVRSLYIPNSAYGIESDGNDEISGYALGERFFVLISFDRIMLLKVKLLAGQRLTGIKMVWTCPTSAIAELRSDLREDLILMLREDDTEGRCSVEYRDVWNAPHPSIHDVHMVDYYVFQEILENVWGSVLARAHPMIPPVDAASCIELSRKRTGIKSIVKSYTTHEYRLYKNMLYEFTACPADVGDEAYHITETGDAASQRSPEVVFNTQSSVGEFLEYVFMQSNKKKSSAAAVFAADGADDGNFLHGAVSVASRSMILTGAIPLIDIRLYGPEQEDACRYSLSIKKRDNTSSLGFLKREKDDLKSRLLYATRDSLTLLFPDRKTAQLWKVYLSESCYVSPASSGVVVPGGSVAVESSVGGTQMGSVGATLGSSMLALPMKKHLVIPLSGTDLAVAERMKVEIAQNLSKL